MITLDKASRIAPEDRQLMLDLRDVVRRYVPDATLLLYGSVARGEQTPESDYDVLVITPDKLSGASEATLHRAVYELGLDRDAVISLFLSTKDEWEQPITKVTPYYQNVTSEGIAIC